jgi:hypothetical protein
MIASQLIGKTAIAIRFQRPFPAVLISEIGNDFYNNKYWANTLIDFGCCSTVASQGPSMFLFNSKGREKYV